MNSDKNWRDKIDVTGNVFHEEDQEKHLKVVSRNNPAGSEENCLTTTEGQKNWSILKVKPCDTKNV
jgi:hypothetical protein